MLRTSNEMKEADGRKREREGPDRSVRLEGGGEGLFPCLVFSPSPAASSFLNRRGKLVLV